MSGSLAYAHFHLLCSITLGILVSWGHHVSHWDSARFLPLGYLMKKEIKDQTITLRLPLSVIEALRQQAVAETRTLQGQILYQLQQALKKK